MDGRLTITDVAKIVSVTTKTLVRWEKTGKIDKPKRDWKGWRFYTEEDVVNIQKIVNAVYEQESILVQKQESILSQISNSEPEKVRIVSDGTEES